MSVLKGLQDLLLKMGGTPVSGDNTDELVRKIAAAYDPATQELPSITSLDKGRILIFYPLTMCIIGITTQAIIHLLLYSVIPMLEEFLIGPIQMIVNPMKHLEKRSFYMILK